MQIKNGKLFYNGELEYHDMLIRGGRIVRITPIDTVEEGEEVLDAAGGYVVPGFIDLHLHGAMGCDFTDADPDGIREIANYLVSRGVTGFLGTTMALPEDELTDALRAAAPLVGQETGGAVLRGIHLEGPFGSAEKCGAQDPTALLAPDSALFDRLNEAAGGSIRIVDVAPELPGAQQFIRETAQKCTVSVGHTAADYDTARMAFAQGAKSVTHLFNAMTPFTHREPGVLPAAQEGAKFAELIVDGVHLHPAAVRMAFQLFGPGRICMVSDAMCGTGTAGGSCVLGGQEVTVKGNKATLADGTLAGSVTDLAQDLEIGAGLSSIPLPFLVRATSENPARLLGIFDEVGSIEPGKRADLVVLDLHDLKVNHVVLNGRQVR